MVIFNASNFATNFRAIASATATIGVIEMAEKLFSLRLFIRYSILCTSVLFLPLVTQAQSGGGVDMTGTGGRHSIAGRLVFPSGQRADIRLKIRLESSGQGDLIVLSDVNGSFAFRSLRAGSYTVVIEGGEFFETARESVYIEPASSGPARTSGVIPVARPFNVQIYLRPKQQVATVKPGVLNVALASIPKAAVELYEKGRESASRNETDKAIDQLKRAIGLYPDFGLALNELGVQYLKRGDLDLAEEALAKVIRLSPDAPEPSLNYGICLLQKKKFAEAETQLRDAVKKNEHAFTAHLYLGITLISFKRYTEAESELRKAIVLGGPKASQAHYYLGGVYWQTGSFRQAADELERFLQLEPKAANAERIRATIKNLRTKS
jgi:Flp pilus assembly protein TadD